jgi:hypothetical protein
VHLWHTSVCPHGPAAAHTSGSAHTAQWSSFIAATDTAARGGSLCQFSVATMYDPRRLYVLSGALMMRLCALLGY